MFTSTLSSKNQVTIPKKLLNLYGAKPGDKIRFIKEDGKILLEPLKQSKVSKIAGSLTKYAKPDYFGKSWGYLMDKAKEDHVSYLVKKYEIFDS